MNDRICDDSLDISELAEKIAAMSDEEFVEYQYQEICKKLGFIPSEYKSPEVGTEDDNWVNPFSVLTIEEQDFLYEHGYLINHND